MRLRSVICIGVCLSAQNLLASDSELAKKSLNPIAAMISVPMQYNYDENIGAADSGERHVLNIQPVIPFDLNDEWNLISRTIIPLVDQDGIVPGGAADASGLGDVVQSLFFSPKQPTDNGWIWGAGPVFLLPTASDDLLGGEQWGLGPTAVALKQENGWTYGALANHIWSFEGEDDRDDVNKTFLQPFLSYTTPGFTTYGVNTESTYDWETEDWSVPVNFTVTQLMKFGQQPVSLQAGVRYWADSTAGGPEDVAFRLSLTLLYPR